MSDAADRPVFAATIRPHRSLTPGGFRSLMIALALVSTGISLPFLFVGFWPVAGFFGLDVLALYVALRVSFRRGEGVEHIILTPIELLFRQISHHGERREWRLNPLWTRLHRVDDDEYGLQHLALVSRGERIVIARDLSPTEREGFAEALGRALAAVKRGY